MISRKKAKQLVQEKYGPTASVVHVSSKNRHERFGVMFVEVGGLDSAKLACFGYGDSYEAAIKMAQENELAKKYAQEWLNTKKDFDASFKNDPSAYVKEKMAEIEQAMQQKSDVGIHEI